MTSTNTRKAKIIFTTEQRLEIVYLANLSNEKKMG